jgi:RNA polymerase sigma-70 factor (ECF subfamily)
VPAAPGLARAETVEDAKSTEASLIEEARGGNADSFSALVELYQERAIHTANSFLGNLEDARDITQEAFVKAYENLSGFGGQSRFYTWFYRILVNTCKDFLRRKKFRQTFSFWLGPEEEGEGLDPLANVADDSANASQELENRELGALITGALEKLPARQKTVFILRYLEGMSLNEIAETLGISEGAAKANLWQAGHKMKALLGGISP